MAVRWGFDRGSLSTSSVDVKLLRGLKHDEILAVNGALMIMGTLIINMMR